MEATEKAYFCYKYIMFDMDACLLSARRGWAACTGTSWHQGQPQAALVPGELALGLGSKTPALAVLGRTGGAGQDWWYWVGLAVLGRTGCAGTAAPWLLLEKVAVTYSPLSRASSCSNTPSRLCSRYPH